MLTGARLSRAEGDLGLAEIIAQQAARAKTELGRRAVRQAEAYADRHAATLALARLQEARELQMAGVGLPLPPEQDIEPLLERTRRGSTLLGLELLAVREGLQAGLALATFAVTHAKGSPHLAAFAGVEPSGRAPLEQVAHALEAAIDNEGELLDAASYELGRLRQRGRSLRQRIRGHLGELMATPELAPLLQDQYVAIRHGRHCLPIVSSLHGRIDGIVHGTSQSGETFFVEPASAVAWGNEDAVLAARIEAEEQRLLAALSQQTREVADAAIALQAKLAELDALAAAVQLATECSLAVPELVDGSEALDIACLRHPTLAIGQRQVVGNDLRLASGGAGLIVSGPNAGGKTAVLTALGLAVAMAQRGLPIAGDAGARVPWFSGLHVLLNDRQDLTLGLSSFSAHLQGLNDMYRTVAAPALVLIDEICAATDPGEGAALAEAILTALIARGASLVVSTHIGALKALPVLDPRFVNARMGIDAQSLRPTYRLELGVAGQSFALDAAARLPIDADLLAAARAALESQPTRLAEAMELASSSERRASAERARLAREREELAQLRERLHAERAADEAAARRQRAQEREEAAEALSAALQAFRAERNEQRLALAVASLRAEARALRSEQQGGGIEAAQGPEQRSPPLPLPAGDDVQTGSQVWVGALGQRGEVVHLEGSSATVLIGAMRMRVPRAELKPVAGVRRTEPPRAAVKVIAAATEAPFAAGTAGLAAPGRIDLRGLRIEAASRAIERALDLSLSEGASELWIIHGHGTGAMREHVRGLLGSVGYVQSWRPGATHEGGDGVTIARLGT